MLVNCGNRESRLKRLKEAICDIVDGIAIYNKSNGNETIESRKVEISKSSQKSSTSIISTTTATSIKATSTSTTTSAVTVTTTITTTKTTTTETTMETTGTTCAIAAEPNSVTCKAMVNDKIIAVHYGEQKLEITGDLEDWKAVNSFSFQPSCGLELKVEVKDVDFQDPTQHCEKYAGFMLRCEATDTTGNVAHENPWHNFSSNIDDWRSEGGEQLCKDGGEASWRESPDLQKLLSTGASIIWARERESTVLIP